MAAASTRSRSRQGASTGGCLPPRRGHPGGSLPRVRTAWLTAFLDFQPPVFAPGCAFWEQVTGYRRSPARGDTGQFAILLPPQGDAFLRVQRIGEGPGGCHLDLHTGDQAGAAAEAVRLGATVRHEEPGLFILRSPGGFTFCLVSDDGEAQRPPPARWPGGHRSLADQLSIDIPAAACDDECAFWAALTGWQPRSGSRPEFRWLARPDGIPLRLLLHRLAEGSGDCRAHLDLACDDVPAEQRRHEALGARPVRVTPGWTTLLDPAGREYCLTRRDPRTGER